MSMTYITVFVTGGIICALSQLLMDKTKLLPGRILVILVCLGCLLGALGIYEPFLEFAKAGASVPLIGFGNSLFKGVKEAVLAEGFIGLFKGGFSKCSVGISGALIIGFVASLIFDSKMKK